MVPATRSARAIDGGEDEDGRDGPLNLDKSQKNGARRSSFERRKVN